MRPSRRATPKDPAAAPRQATLILGAHGQLCAASPRPVPAPASSGSTTTVVTSLQGTPGVASTNSRSSWPGDPSVAAVKTAVLPGSTLGTAQAPSQSLPVHDFFLRPIGRPKKRARDAAGSPSAAEAAGSPSAIEAAGCPSAREAVSRTADPDLVPPSVGSRPITLSLTEGRRDRGTVRARQGSCAIAPADEGPSSGGRLTAKRQSGPQCPVLPTGTGDIELRPPGTIGIGDTADPTEPHPTWTVPTACGAIEDASIPVTATIFQSWKTPAAQRLLAPRGAPAASLLDIDATHALQYSSETFESINAVTDVQVPDDLLGADGNSRAASIDEFRACQRQQVMQFRAEWFTLSAALADAQRVATSIPSVSCHQAVRSVLACLETAWASTPSPSPSPLPSPSLAPTSNWGPPSRLSKGPRSRDPLQQASRLISEADEQFGSHAWVGWLDDSTLDTVYHFLKRWTHPYDDGAAQENMQDETDAGNHDNDHDDGTWGDDDDPAPLAAAPRHLLLVGPTGSSKTAVVYQVAVELGYEVIEMNTSHRRSGRDLLLTCGEATQSQRMTRQYDNAAGTQLPNGVGARSLILLDDVDLLYEDDRGFWPSLASLMAKSRRPIVLTCTLSPFVPYNALLGDSMARATASRLSVVTTKPPDIEADAGAAVCAVMALRARAQGILFSDEILRHMVEEAGGDARAIRHIFDMTLRLVHHRTAQPQSRSNLAAPLDDGSALDAVHVEDGHPALPSAPPQTLGRHQHSRRPHCVRFWHVERCPPLGPPPVTWGDVPPVPVSASFPDRTADQAATRCAAALDPAMLIHALAHAITLAATLTRCQWTQAETDAVAQCTPDGDGETLVALAPYVGTLLNGGIATRPHVVAEGVAPVDPGCTGLAWASRETLLEAGMVYTERVWNAALGPPSSASRGMDMVAFEATLDRVQVASMLWSLRNGVRRRVMEGEVAPMLVRMARHGAARLHRLRSGQAADVPHASWTPLERLEAARQTGVALPLGPRRTRRGTIHIPHLWHETITAQQFGLLAITPFGGVHRSPTDEDENRNASSTVTITI
ncbi:hypothetical protein CAUPRSCDRAFT_11405 [Caulochytrium protostelioides]|uniref:AAA+ ATPase domain-containing protein n=1 Tax=Caulochytrium protostelioides TaxID=1555241 RepID=A0A4P9WXD3_9FUNG|nr:hypothetical protein CAUPRSCDRAFT_11405 [Caulochytrium protostelioides]